VKITRLYTGPDGESHFEDIDFPLKRVGDAQEQSEVIYKAKGVVLRRTSANMDLSWHPAPQRQLVITLSGQGEIEVGDGTKRRFGPGDIMLADDLTGRGHITRAVNNQPRTSLWVTLE